MSVAVFLFSKYWGTSDKFEVIFPLVFTWFCEIIINIFGAKDIHILIYWGKNEVLEAIF